jgi:hypothetical protein
MGKVVEDDVVRMQFENGQFEKKIRQSQKSIEALKKSIDFSESGKSLAKFQNETKKFNMDGMGRAVEAVQVKFSAMDTVAMSVLNRLTNAAVDAGKKIVSALAFDGMSDGWNEYKLKMNSIQTIIMSTGESLSTVNKYLDELNKYSDRTIYSFSDMTANIGKFTNAGVGLKDAVAAIKGVSNEAAISGANAEQASHAMYNFAQALSAGYVKLIDWKSIEVANMATMDFKQNLLDTAVALGTVVKKGEDYYTTTTNAKGATSDAFNATKNWNDNLQYQWMTTDVLVQTLSKYTDETTELGQKAYAAASEFKDAGQMFAAWKEAIGSGWEHTWETIFGNFEESKKLWGFLDNIIGNYIVKTFAAKNATLDAWKKMGGRNSLMRSFVNVMAAAVGVLDTFRVAYRAIFPEKNAKEIKSITDAFEVFTKKLIMSRDKVDKLYRTLKGLFTIVKIVKNVLGVGLKIALQIVSKLLGVSVNSVLDLTAVLGDGIVQFDKFAKVSDVVAKGVNLISSAIAFSIKNVEYFAKAIWNWKGTQEVIKLLDELIVKTLWPDIKDFGENAGKLIDEFIDHCKEVGHIDFKALLSTILGIGAIAKESFGGAGDSIDSFTSKLYSLRSKITGYLKGWTDQAAGFKKTMIDTFDGVFSFIEDKSGKVNTANILTILLGGVSVKALYNLSKLLQVLTDRFGGLFALPAAIGNSFIKLMNQGALTLKTWQDSIKADIVIKIAKALAILVGSIALLTVLPQDRIEGAVVLIGILGAALTAFAYAIGSISTEKLAKGFSGVSAMVISIAGSILLMTVALEKLQNVTINKSMAINIGVITGLVGVITICSGALTKYTMGANAKLAAAGALQIVSLAASLLLMVKAIKGLSNYNIEDAGSTIGALVLAVGSLSVLMIAVGKANGLGGARGALTLLSSVVAIYGLAKVMSKISKMDFSSMKKGWKQFVAVFGTMMLLFKASAKAGPNASKAAVLLLGFTVSLHVLLAAFEKLQKYDFKTMAKCITDLIALMIPIGGLIKASASAGQYAARAGVMMMTVAGSIVILTAAIAILSGLDQSKMAGATAAVDSIILCMSAMIKAGDVSIDAKKSVIVAALVVGEIAGVIALLAQLDPTGVMAGSAAISLLLGVFTLCLKGFAGVGKVRASVLLAGAVLLEIAGVIGLVTQLDWKRSLAASAGLSMVLLSISASMLILQNVPIAGAINALGSFSIFVAGLAAIIAVLGGLNKIPGFQDFMNGGVQVLEILGEGLGKLVGGIISGVTDGLPQIATNLSDFANNLQPFLSTMGNVNPEIGSSMSVLAGCIVKIAGAEIVNAISTFINLGKDPIQKFAYQLQYLGAGMKAYGDQVAGVNPETVKGTAIAAKTLVELANAIPRSGGLAQLLAGAKDLADFGLSLIPFGAAFAMYAMEVANINPGVIKGTSSAAQTLTDLANAIPEAGGLKQLLTGSKSLTSFGLSLIPFGAAFATYSSLVAGVNTETVKATSAAAMTITEFANSIPQLDGMKEWFVGGSEDLGTFGKSMVSFGNSFAKYSDAVSKVDTESINATSSAAMTITKLAGTIPSLDGMKEWFVGGSQDLGTFGKSMVSFGKSFAKYSKTVSGIDTSTITATSAAATSIAKLNDDLPEATSAKSILFGGNKESLKKFGKNLVSFGESFVSFSATIKGADTSNAGTIAKQLSDFINSLNGIKGGLDKKVKDMNKAFKALGKTSLKSVQNGFESKSGDFEKVGSKVVGWISTGMKNNSEDMKSPSSSVAKKFLKYVTDAFKSDTDTTDGFNSVVNSALSTAQSTFKDYNSKFKSAGSSLAKNLASGMKSNSKVFSTAGANAAIGFMSGAKNKSSEVYSTGVSLGNQLLKGMKSKKSLDEHSPSKKTNKIGAYAGEGLVKGVKSKAGDVELAGIDMGRGALLGAGKGIKDGAKKAQKTVTGYVKGIKKSISKSVGNKDVDGVMKTVNGILNAGNSTFSDQMDKTTKDIIKNANKTGAGVTSAYDSTSKKITGRSKKNSKKAKINMTKIIKVAYQFGKTFDKAVSSFNKTPYETITKISKSLGKELLKTTPKLKTLSKATKTAEKTIKNFAIALYKESDQYKEDTKSVKQHEAALKKLLKTQDRLKKGLSASGKKLSKKNLNSAIKENSTAIKNAVKQLKDDQKTIQSNINSTFKEYRNNIINSIKEYTKFTNIAFDNSRNIFSEFSDSMDDEMSTVLKNMESQVDGYQEMKDNLAKLSKNGLSKGLIDTLKGMGESGYAYIKLFANASKEEIDRANTAYAEASKQTKEDIIASYKQTYQDAVKWKSSIKKMLNQGWDIRLVQELVDEGPGNLSKVLEMLTFSDEERKEINDVYVKNLKLQKSGANDIIKSFALRKEKEAAKNKAKKSVKKTAKEVKKDVKEIPNAVSEAAKEMEKNLKKINNDWDDAKKKIEDTAKSMTESVKSSLDSFTSFVNFDISSSTDYFTRYDEVVNDLGNDTIIDRMWSQVNAEKRVIEGLEELKKMRFADGLLDYLKSLGTQAIPYIEGFKLATSEQITEVNNLFAEKMQMTKDSVKQQARDNVEAVKKWEAEILDLAKSLDPRLLKELVDQGMSAADLVDVYYSMTPAERKEMNDLYVEKLSINEEVAKTVSDSYKEAGLGAVNSMYQGMIDAATGKDVSSKKGSSRNLKGSAATKTVHAVAKSFDEVLKKDTSFKSSGKKAGNQFKAGIDSASEGVAKSAKQSAEKACTAFTNYAETNFKKAFKSSGTSLGYCFALGLAAKTVLTAVESSCKSVVDKALSSFSKGSGKASSKGSALGNSFAQGIRGAIPSAVSAAQELVDAVNAVLSKIQMPSLSTSVNTSNLSSMVSSGVTSATGSSVAGASAGLAASIASSLAGGVFGKSNISKAISQLQNGGRSSRGSIKGSSAPAVTNNYTFNQTNNSPVALSNKEIYRQTKNQFSQLKGALK